MTPKAPDTPQPSGARAQRVAAALLAALILSACALPHPPAAAQTQRSKKDKTMEVRLTTSPMDIARSTLSLQPLRAAAPGPAPAAAGPAPTPLGIAPNGSDAQNGRTHALPAGTLAPVWRADLPAELTPRFVLTQGNVVAVQAAQWQLLDINGQKLGSGFAGPGQPLLDSAVLMSIDVNGYLAGNEVGDGRRRFIILPVGGDASMFSLISKRGSEVLIAGFEQPKADFEQLDRSATLPPAPGSDSHVEVMSFGEGIRVRAGGMLTGVKTRNLRIPSAPLFAARGPRIVWAAVPGALLALGADLSVSAAYELKAQPLAISSDEADNAHLIVSTDKGRALLRVSAQGTAWPAVALPDSAERLPKPPTVAADGRVFVASGGSLIAVSPAGQVLWTKTVSATPGGLAVTPDGTLLVADGTELAAFNAAGERRVLYASDRGALITPPVVSAQGQVLVASKTHLIALRAR
jgi:hypothetical protein